MLNTGDKKKEKNMIPSGSSGWWRKYANNWIYSRDIQCELEVISVAVCDLVGGGGTVEERKAANVYYMPDTKVQGSVLCKSSPRVM